MERRVGVRELRQNLSRYLVDVKRGGSVVVTERGQQVARLVPWGPADAPLARLVAERGATMPRIDLLALEPAPPADLGAPDSASVLDELREERL